MCSGCEGEYDGQPHDEHNPHEHGQRPGVFHVVRKLVPCGVGDTNARAGYRGHPCEAGAEYERHCDGERVVAEGHDDGDNRRAEHQHYGGVAHELAYERGDYEYQHQYQQRRDVVAEGRDKRAGDELTEAALAQGRRQAQRAGQAQNHVPVHLG